MTKQSQKIAAFVNFNGGAKLPKNEVLSIVSHEFEQVFADCFASFKQAMVQVSNDTDVVLVTNSPDLETLSWFNKNFCASNSNSQVVLITSETISVYSPKLEGEDASLVHQVIGNISEDWTVDCLRVTLQKIRTNDFFGLNKYLNPNTVFETRAVTSSRNRETINSEVQAWVENSGLTKNYGRLAYGIVEELLMNAIYDAPSAGGKTTYSDLDRTEHRDLLSEDCSELSFGFDSRYLAFSMRDPFGAFTHDKWWHYARKILKRADSNSLIDTKKEGAGLGLFKMLYSSHGVVCNVSPGKSTEVIVLIDTRIPIRDFSTMPRSMHYFSVRS